MSIAVWQNFAYMLDPFYCTEKSSVISPFDKPDWELRQNCDYEIITFRIPSATEFTQEIRSEINLVKGRCQNNFLAEVGSEPLLDRPTFLVSA